MKTNPKEASEVLRHEVVEVVGEVVEVVGEDNLII